MTTQTDALVAGLSAVTEALRAACTDPADQIRLLSSLATYAPTVATSSAPIGGAMATAQTAMAALARRAALQSLALATAAYQPSSYNDAQSVLSAVSALIEAEAVVAADAGDTQTYLSLRALRAAVVSDLTTRGSQLAQLVTVQTLVPLPSLVLAWNLYQDATRADDLVTRANPVHPAFMPTSFQALAS